ncbi:MAG: chemotaxis protein CheW [Planctomycetales bacterium]|nr:chemotaxis protein CheW [Planctomycetales bacterium]
MTTNVPAVPAQHAHSGASDTFQLVSFRLGREEYGIEITRVREIILMGEITRLPQTPPHIKGLINLRSTVIPVVDLRLRFGMPTKEADDDTRIVVVTVDEKTVGLIVDAVSEVMRVSRDLLSAPPCNVCGPAREYPAQIVQLGNRLIILLDIQDILGQSPLDPAELAAAEA